jgi:gamma-glutamyl phosphate reductase
MSAAGAREFAQKARNASRKLQALPTEERVAMLNRVADAILASEEAIMAENKKVSLAKTSYLCMLWAPCCYRVTQEPWQQQRQ